MRFETAGAEHMHLISVPALAMDPQRANVNHTGSWNNPSIGGKASGIPQLNLMTSALIR